MTEDFFAAKVEADKIEAERDPDAKGYVAWLPDGSRFSLGEAVAAMVEEIGKSVYNLPTGYLSPSQVGTYMRCPKQYEFRYIQRLKTARSGPLIQGSGLHESFELGYNIRKNDPEAEVPYDQVMDAYNDYIKNNLSDDIIFSETEPEDILREQGEKVVALWHKEKLQTVFPVRVEAPFVADLKGVPTVGIVDLIDKPPGQLATVADNKTSGKKKNQAEADSSLQLSLYAAVSGITQQRLDVYVRPKLGKRGVGEAKLQELFTTRHSGDIEWLVSVFHAIAAAISAGAFPPTDPNNWVCSAKWCGYWDKCRGRSCGRRE